MNSLEPKPMCLDQPLWQLFVLERLLAPSLTCMVVTVTLLRWAPLSFARYIWERNLDLLSPGRVFLSSWELFYYYYFSLAMTFPLQHPIYSQIFSPFQSPFLCPHYLSRWPQFSLDPQGQKNGGGGVKIFLGRVTAGYHGTSSQLSFFLEQL